MRENLYISVIIINVDVEFAFAADEYLILIFVLFSMYALPFLTSYHCNTRAMR